MPNKIGSKKLQQNEISSKNGIQVIARAAAVLRCLKDQPDGLSLGQIAAKISLPRSTIQRIVGALQEERLLMSASPGRGIRLGPELSSLAESAKVDLSDMLKPYLIDLAQKTKETVDLAVLRGRRMIFVDQIPGTHRLRTISSVGDAFPLCSTANGKACLSKLDDTRILSLLNAEQPALAADEGYVEAFMAEINNTRSTGLSYDRDEHTVGISAIGISFHDLQGNIYAITTPTPTSRFHDCEKHLEECLLNTLETINKLEIIDSRVQ